MGGTPASRNSTSYRTYPRYYVGDATGQNIDVAPPRTSSPPYTYPLRYFNGVTNHPYSPVFRDLHFENFAFGKAGTGIYIEGLPQKPVTNVFFKNISIGSVTNPGTINHAVNVHLDNVKVGNTVVQP